MGDQPLANNLHTGQYLEEFPLAVKLCRNCFHSQLSIAVDPEILYTDYCYVTGTSQTFKEHCRILAKHAFTRHHLLKPKTVLDIACNDGTLLEEFKKLGLEVLGIDPAQNLAERTTAKGIPVIIDYWEAGAHERLPKQYDIITATNVFAHVDDPLTFLSEAAKALTDKGTIVIEFPYSPCMINRNEFDTIYHEHLSYFNMQSFLTLVNRCKPRLYIDGFTRTEIHGGSIRFYLMKHRATFFDKHFFQVDKLIEQESQKGIYNPQTYREFTAKIISNISLLKNFLEVLRKDGRKVIGYGASAKGNTMLNTASLGYKDVDYIVDDTPLKCGKYTPGSNIPICGIDKLIEEEDPTVILMLAWNFGEEIQKRIEENCKVPHAYLYYVPEVTVR